MAPPPDRIGELEQRTDKLVKAVVQLRGRVGQLERRLGWVEAGAEEATAAAGDALQEALDVADRLEAAGEQ